MHVPVESWDPDQLTLVKRLGEVFIERPQLTSAVNAIVNHFLENEDGNDPGFFLLTGDTGTGKTTVLTRSIEKIRELCNGASSWPVASFTLPENCTRKDFMSMCLESIGEPAAHTGTRTAMEQRFHNAVKRKRVRIVFVNEIQHLINSDNDEINYVTADLLKIFSEAFRFPVVLVGLPEALRVFQSNCQLPGRCHDAISLARLSLGTASEVEECQMSLRDYDERLPFPEYCMLAHPNQIVAHIEASDGNPRQMTKLTKHAGKNAIRARTRRIEAEHWQMAWATLVGKVNPNQRNPYEGLVIPNAPAK